VSLFLSLFVPQYLLELCSLCYANNFFIPIGPVQYAVSLNRLLCEKYLIYVLHDHLEVRFLELKWHNLTCKSVQVRQLFLEGLIFI
jgi:hypothetical protein